MAAQVESIKWIQGTNFMVDGFRFQNPRCQHYFLTHAHSDHTTGLQKSFASGVIYCSPITKALLRKKEGMPPERIVPLEMDMRHSINGVGVTLIDANHCPGAAMILFEVPAPAGAPPKVTRILHVGDFRFDESMVRHPALADKPLDVLYLDTTYAHPRHTHPPQDHCIARMVEVVHQEHAQEPNTLFVIGAYSIGKERAFLGTAKALGWHIWCDPNKVRILHMLGLPQEDLALLTTDKKAAKIHVTFMGAQLQPEKLLARMRIAKRDRIVGFRPTGWSYKKSGKLEVRKEGPVTVYGVPYSEHSAFNELRDCVRLLRPRKIVPTVNITEDSATTRAIVDRFADLMDLSGDKSRLDLYFRCGAKCGKVKACSSSELKSSPSAPPATSLLRVKAEPATAGRLAQPVLLPVKAQAAAADQEGACSSAATASAVAAGSLEATDREAEAAHHGMWPSCDSPTASSGLGSPNAATAEALEDAAASAWRSCPEAAHPAHDARHRLSQGLDSAAAGGQAAAATATEQRAKPLEKSFPPSSPLPASSRSIAGDSASPTAALRSASAPAATTAMPVPPQHGSTPAVSSPLGSGDSAGQEVEAEEAAILERAHTNLKEQEAIFAMIQSRNAHRTGSGGASAAQPWASLQRPPAADNVASPAGSKRKRQRTLAGFVLSSA